MPAGSVSGLRQDRTSRPTLRHGICKGLRAAWIGSLAPWALWLSGCGQSPPPNDADRHLLQVQSEPSLLLPPGPAGKPVQTERAVVHSTAVSEAGPALSRRDDETTPVTPPREYRSDNARPDEIADEDVMLPSPLHSMVVDEGRLEPIAETDATIFSGESMDVVELPNVAPATHELAAIEARLDELVRHGYQLGERGAIYSARSELVSVLRLLADSHDGLSGDTRHATALGAGFAALREAADFQPRGSAMIGESRMRDLIRDHATPVLKGDRAHGVSPTQAAARYYTFAQEQLAYATGQSRVGADALYGLGRIAQPASSAAKAADLSATAQTLVYFQSALMVHPAHFRAAHECGVLLAQCGRLEQSRKMFEQAIASSPQAASFANLAVIEDRLGRREAADAARRRAVQLGGVVAGNPRPQVRWVDARDFSRVAVGQNGVTPAPATTVNSEAKPATATAAKNSRSDRPTATPAPRHEPTNESTASQWNRVFQRK